MIEQHKASGEQHEDSLDTKELKARQHEALHSAKEKAERSKNDHAENLDNIRSQIEKEATNAKEMSVVEKKQQDEPDSANTYWYSREYRELAFKQLMGKVRGHLSTSEKLGSKIIHQPVVERVSEISGKTIARPSGVLMGSIFSFTASLVTYFFAKQNGYDMTYSIFFASFVGGFVLGIAIEFGYRMVRSLMSRD